MTIWQCSACPYGPCQIIIDGTCFFDPLPVAYDRCLVNKGQLPDWTVVDSPGNTEGVSSL
jgi:hypothetical protein